MLAYARAAVAEDDYEAAISTLERLVDLDPAAQEARYELALAYFALGSNELAQYHLDIYEERADLSVPEQASAEAFSQAADTRTSGSRFSGFVEGGVAGDFDAEASGLSYGLGLQSEIDLGGANAGSWDTLLRITGAAYSNNSDASEAAALFRTGPSLSLDGNAFGSTLRPYLEIRYIDDDDDPDDGTRLSLGLDYSRPLGPTTALTLGLDGGQLYRDGDLPDASYVGARLGASFDTGRGTTGGAVLRYFDENADLAGDDRERIGLRLVASQALGSGWLGLDDWSLSGFAASIPTATATAATKKLWQPGLWVRSYFSSNGYVKTSFRVFDRSSNDPAFEATESVLSVEVGTEF